MTENSTTKRLTKYARDRGLRNWKVLRTTQGEDQYGKYWAGTMHADFWYFARNLGFTIKEAETAIDEEVLERERAEIVKAEKAACNGDGGRRDCGDTGTR